MRKAVFAVVVGWAILQAPVHAAIIITTDVVASSSASFTFQNVTYSAQSVVQGIESAASQALAGNNNTPEGRTAARVNVSEIAANARLDGKSIYFPTTDIQDNGSILTYTGVIEKVTGSAEHILLNFYLPPSYVETTSNAEIRDATLNPFIFAEVSGGYCASLVSCGPSTELFDFQAYLDSTWNSFSSFRSATGQAGMDLSPLLNPVLTDNYGSNDFLRTANLAFPGYAGTVDLGVLSVGQFMQFTYRMEARALGVASANVGIASINDPFFLDSDPVRQGAPVSITTAPFNGVPEPGALALFASGLALLVLRAIRK